MILVGRKILELANDVLSLIHVGILLWWVGKCFCGFGSIRAHWLANSKVVEIQGQAGYD